MNNGGGVAGYNPSQFLVNLQSLQNVVTSADGLDPITILSNTVANIQEMVNYDQKRIFINTISKFNTTPIQVTDDINLSNANLYIGGTQITNTSGSGGGSSQISTGGNSIYITSTLNTSTTAIGMQIGGRTIFSLDGYGRALYYDPSGTGNRFWISSATLVADKVAFGGNGLKAAAGKFLQSQDLSGTGQWAYVSSLIAGDTSIHLSSSGVFIQTAGIPAGRIDSRRNWYLGYSSLKGNDDLTTSNDVIILGGALRYQNPGFIGNSNVGSFLTVLDTLGNIGFSTASGSVSSFIIGDQIASGTTSIKVFGSDGTIRFNENGSEVARMSNGLFGLGVPAPLATLDIQGTALVRGGPLQLSTVYAAVDKVFTAIDLNGTGQWNTPQRLFDSLGQELRVSTVTSSIHTTLLGSEILRISTQGTYLGANRPYTSYRLSVNGPIQTTQIASLSSLVFSAGGSLTQIAAFTESGQLGIGTLNPSYTLQVVGTTNLGGSVTITGATTVGGNITTSGNLTASGNLTIGGTTTLGVVTATSFAGSGASITGIVTSNVGSGSNQLDVFQNYTYTNIQTLQTGLSSLSTFFTSSINAIVLTGATSFYSTLSSYLTTTSNSLSSQIGQGASVAISSFSTALGLSLEPFFESISTVCTNQVSYTSTFSFRTASTLDQRVYTNIRRGLAIGKGEWSVPLPISALEVSGNVLFNRGTRLWISTGGIAINYKTGQDISGALDISGLIYSRGLKGLSAPFGLGVGTSTTAVFNKFGYTPGQGWKLQIQGDVDISGYLYKNGVLYGTGGTPDFYWGKNDSNLYYGDGYVGIGTPTPGYPLDVVGKIRCWGVDIVQGPGPAVSTGQGSYVSPWLYQSSNIYYKYGGIGVGTGISSVKNGVFFDLSGSIRQRYGAVYLEQSTLAVGYPWGTTDLSGSFDVSGSIHARSLTIDSTGVFGGRVSAHDFLTYSDIRLKKDLEAITAPSANKILEDIRGYRYTWKTSGVKDIGFIAQTVLQSFPEASGGSYEDGYQVGYDKFIPVLWELVRNLKTEVKELKEKVQRLESRL